MITVIHTSLSNKIKINCKAAALITLASLMMACSGGAPVCQCLLGKLDCYMNRYDCKVYGMFFTFEEGLIHITITGSHQYNEVLTDGYFFRNGKLVTYSFVDNKSHDSILYRKRTEPFTGNIKGYESFNPYSIDTNGEPPPPKYLVALSADSILAEDENNITIRRKHPAHSYNVVKHKAFNDSINSFINTTTGHMTILRIGKKDGFLCYTIRSQNTYCKEHAIGYFLRDTHPVVIYIDENNMSLDISPIIDVSELKSSKDGIGNYRDYPDNFYFFNWGYKIVGDRIEILPREENNPPVL